MNDDENDRPSDEGIGAEGGESKEKLPPVPDKDDDTPLGDTDQHSKVPSPPADV